MMQFTEEQRNELLAEIDYNRKNCFLSSKTEQLMKIAEAALKAEPVAYRWEDKKTGSICYDGIRPIGVFSQPLYAAPPVAASAVPEQGSDAVNDAAWLLHDLLAEGGPLTGHQFNNLKGSFYEAMKVALGVSAPDKPQ